MRSKRLSIGRVFIVALLLASPAFAQAQKLNYQEVQLLKDAKYYLSQIEGNVENSDVRSKAWKVGDATVPLDQVEQMLGARSQVDQQLKYADNRFASLPANHPDVAKERKRRDEVAAKIEATFKHLGELKAGLAGVVAQGESPEFKKDFERLMEINKMIADSRLLVQEPERDVATIAQLDQVRAEQKRFAQTYAALLNQRTQESQAMKNQLEHFDEVMKEFDARAVEWKAAAPAKLDGYLAEATNSAKRAAVEKRPLWFSPTSGIAANLGYAQAHVDLWKAFGPDAPEVKAAQAKVDAARQEVAAAAKTLEADILAANRVPEERFNGADKDELIAKMKQAWAADGLKGDVLAAGMNSEGWRRESRWEWNGGAWRQVDLSRTQGFVVRKVDDAMAAVYYVNFTKDHLQGDRMTVYLFDDVKVEPAIERKILVANIK